MNGWHGGLLHISLLPEFGAGLGFFRRDVHLSGFRHCSVVFHVSGLSLFSVLLSVLSRLSLPKSFSDGIIFYLDFLSSRSYDSR